MGAACLPPLRRVPAARGDGLLSRARELPPNEAYALWAPRYPPRAHTPLMEMEQAALLELLPPLAGLRVLDAACGSGRYLGYARRQGARAVGCDASAAMLARVEGVPCVRGDLRALPFREGAFDLVICGLALGDVPELAAVLRSVARVLRPGGTFVASDLHPDGARRGWQRSFEAGGRAFAVRHHVHDLEAWEQAARASALVIEERREPRVEFEHPWRGRPAALVLRLRKP